MTMSGRKMREIAMAVANANTKRVAVYGGELFAHAGELEEEEKKLEGVLPNETHN